MDRQECRESLISLIAERKRTRFYGRDEYGNEREILKKNDDILETFLTALECVEECLKAQGAAQGSD